MKQINLLNGSDAKTHYIGFIEGEEYIDAYTKTEALEIASVLFATETLFEMDYRYDTMGSLYKQQPDGNYTIRFDENDEVEMYYRFSPTYHEEFPTIS